ncbi:MAG: molybdopterin-dependent oxidoreductase [Novosphingobium sp.]
MTEKTLRTFCRFCHASCAMLVDVVDDKVTAVRGDPENTLFHGYTCVKGRQMPEMHNVSERILRPLVRQDGQKQGPFVETSTAEALAGIAAKIKAVIAEHGPHSVALYCGTNAFQNSAVLGTSYALAEAIGTRNYYTSVTVDQPAKVFTTSRYGQWMGGPNNFEESDVVMFVGNNPLVSHYTPSGGVPPFSPSRRLRDAKARGLKVIVADPRESDTGVLADLYLQVKPGEDPALLGGMLHVIIKEGLYDRNFVSAYVDGFDELAEALKDFTPDVAAERAGISAEEVVAAARMFAKAAKGRVVTGTGPEMAGKGVLTEYLVTALNIVCARFNQAGDKVANPMVFMPFAAGPKKAQVAPPMAMFGEGFALSRIRGIGKLGTEMPCPVLADEILTPGEGQVKVLISIGGNPEIAFPNQRKVRKALETLELFVQVDPFMSASAKRADVILAPSMCLEREDINNVSQPFCEEPYAHYAEAMVPPPGDTMDEYEMLWWLAKHLGLELKLPGGPCPMDAVPDKMTMLDLISHGCLVKPSQARADSQASDTPGGPVLYPAAHATIAPADPDAAHKFQLGAGAMPAAFSGYATARPEEDGFDFRLISRRSKHRYNSNGHISEFLKKKMPTNPAFFHPDDLAALAIAEGDVIEITSRVATIHAVTQASDKVRRGVISMSHAWGSDDAGKDEVRVEGGSTNRLIDDAVDMDPITGMPVQSAIPVRVSAA